ncbi:MAG: type I-B CRISPR-associated protein Cas5 [Clostridiales bacterium 38-18]|nr:MAG: type I-B CRISPR-associated protein Cas5 [Clostridiales bacterium 38-18]
MKAIQFTLSGKTAHFKRPDVNAYAYFTYNHIPKVTLLGLLGAILGIKGYLDQGEKEFPEFYERLKGLKVAIVPIGRHQGVFSKKIQVFNNSVGYASQEAGNNLIIREQWLEEVVWRIYISSESNVEEELLKKLFENLLNQKAIFIPYLGKNDHTASITDVKLIELSDVPNAERLDSLYLSSEVTLDEETWNDKRPYTFEDILPLRLNVIGMYECERVGKTNRVVVHAKQPIYKSEIDYVMFL